jgi:diacylglycerol kinase
MNTNKSSPFSIKKRKESFKYAFKGLAFILSSQANFLIHLVIAIVVTIAGLVFNVSNIEWIILVLTFALVLSAEAVNTAIEKLTDIVSPDYSKPAGNVKDIAAASVLITTIASVIIGLIIFLPRIICYYKNL